MGIAKTFTQARFLITPNYMASNIIVERAFQFACQIVKLCEKLWARETVYWLRVAIATGIVTTEEVAKEFDEAQQLKAMTTAAVKTAQLSTWRGSSQPPNP